VFGGSDLSSQPLDDVLCTNQTSMQVFRALFKLIRVHGQLVFRMTAQKGFYPGQAVALAAIARKPGISQRELADFMHVAPPTVANMLKSLERAGFVERKVDSQDQRFVRIQLTEKGSNAAKSIDEIFSEICDVSLDGLDEEKKQVLVDLLSKIAENMLRHMENLGGANEYDKTAQ